MCHCRPQGAVQVPAKQPSHVHAVLRGACWPGICTRCADTVDSGTQAIAECMA